MFRNYDYSETMTFRASETSQILCKNRENKYNIVMSLQTHKRNNSRNRTKIVDSASYAILPKSS